MKIVTPEQMRHIEELAYKAGACEEDFMEEAGSGVGLVVHEFVEELGLERQVLLLCGKGNNAGDAYVAGIHLLHLDYHVHAYQLFPLDQCSPLCRENAQRFLLEGGLLTEVEAEPIPYPVDGVIIDGIFGTGFNDNVPTSIAQRIEEANRSGLPIIAVDIPSGLNGQTGKADPHTIEAAQTAFLGLPKIGFFLNNGWNFVGKLRYVDFGLPLEYSEKALSDVEMLSDGMVIPLLPAVVRNRHKYQAGHVAGLAGSPQMVGAAYLATLGALRSGAGIAKLLYPAGMEPLLTHAPYELVRTPYTHAKQALELLNGASSAYIGPGLGQTDETFHLLEQILPRLRIPTVVDADALNFLAKHPVKLPMPAIFTPHRGELERLLGPKKGTTLDAKFLKICQNFTEEHQITLVVKGGPTFIFHPGEKIYISPVGDPGMATAGAGDVLTGILAGLLAQGLSTLDAARLGVYLHGVAGEQASLEKTPYCMIASDLLDFLPLAFSFSAYNP